MNDETHPAEYLERIRYGFITTQLGILAERLDLAGLLADGAKTAAQIAAAIDADPDAVMRWMRGFAVIGLVTRTEDGGYAAAQALGSIKQMMMAGCDADSYIVWSKAEHTLKTGEPSWSQSFDMTYYEWLDQQTDKSANFDYGNQETARATIPLFNEIWTFPENTTLVDLGGGTGIFLTGVMAANPSMQGVLLERPSVIENAKKLVADAGLTDRVTFQPGSFFEDIPAGDVYVLARVLLNWNDTQAAAILKNLRAGMQEGATLLVLDFVMPEPDQPGYGGFVMNDLSLMVSWGGANRSQAQWLALFAATGFQVKGYKPIPQTPVFVIELSPNT